MEEALGNAMFIMVPCPAQHQELCYCGEREYGGRGQVLVSATCPVFGDQPHVDPFCLLPTSCPEDRGHEEEAAAVHRALQVAAQLPQPLVRLFRTGVRRAHKPGTWGGKAHQNQGACRSQGCSKPLLRWIFFFFLFNFINNSMFIIDFTFP